MKIANAIMEQIYEAFDTDPSFGAVLRVNGGAFYVEVDVEFDEEPSAASSATLDEMERCVADTLENVSLSDPHKKWATDILSALLDMGLGITFACVELRFGSSSWDFTWYQAQLDTIRSIRRIEL